jgi:DNA-binding CsgD family transcriptional regulator
VLGEFASTLRGRSDERRELDRLRRRVEAGESATLVIRGEAGVGKSALLRYVEQQAATEFRVAEIAGVESEMELAYAGLHQLCAPMLDQLDGLPQPQRSALSVAFGLTDGPTPDLFLVGLAALTLLAQVAETRPLLCLVDDAQWLDVTSAQVLGFVARRLEAESVGMVFAVRESRDERPFVGLSEMIVEGLRDDDARALLATVVPGRLDDRVRDRLVTETGGNPLALLELPRGMTAAELAGGFGLPHAGAVQVHIEDSYLRRVRGLPPQSQQLMLLAAADSIGDAATVWRAASAVGIGPDAAGPPARENLLEIGTRVRFRHPLVRSAVYHSATPEERRTAHEALATASDPVTDADRRAWHRAHAAPGPDSEVAAELERCAGRAQTRGGVAAAAALLERAARLTADESERLERMLEAAESKRRAGAFGEAIDLLAEAESEATDELAIARIELVRGRVASVASFGDGSLQLVTAATRLRSLDAVLARETYLDAWAAALFAGHLAPPGGTIVDVARAVTSVPGRSESLGPFDEMLDGLATLIIEGRAAAAPALRRALSPLVTNEVPVEQWLRWGVLVSSVAVTLWDFDGWSATSARKLAFARDTGALAVLSIALSGHGLIATWSGDFAAAAALVAEDEAITQATGARIAPYAGMLLAAYQGRVAEASAQIAATTEDAVIRGEGLGVDLARWTAAVLNNGACRYEEALATASPANADMPGVYLSTWMLPERIEAAVRCGRPEVAAAALQEFVASAHVGKSDWGRGVEARSRALVSDGEEAESHYRSALDFIGRTRIRTELARTHLVYGEWLRRQHRRVDAREHLHAAYDMFAQMPADGFAERARRELLATGEQVRKRTDVTRSALTSQEEHIARLAREGRTNSEIAAELYLSPRTVEFHLRKVFTKLGVNSRRDLKVAMRSPTR